MTDSCLFCKIVAGQLPATFVYQDENVIAFRDLHPKAPQHILVVPTRHIPSMADLTPSDNEIVGQIVAVANQVAKEQHLKNGYRFITNVGHDAGQSVPHLHFHLLGGKELAWEQL